MGIQLSNSSNLPLKGNFTLFCDQIAFDKQGHAVPLTSSSLYLKIENARDLILPVEPGKRKYRRSDSKSPCLDSTSESVKLTVRDQQGRVYLVPVKVKELAQRWMTSDAKIRKYVHAGSLDEPLQRKLARLQSIFEDYQKLYDAHFKKDPNATIDGFNSEQIMKMVRTFHKVIASGEESALLSFGSVKDKYHLKDVEILAHRDPVQGLKMARYDKKVELGRGAFAVVYRVAQLDLNKMKALKVAEPRDPNNQALYEEDLRNEYNILHKVHANGRVEGIQEPPHALFNVKTGSKNIVAMSGQEYEIGNAEQLLAHPDYVAAPLEVKMNSCAKLLEGAIRLEELGILHLDQKPKNALVNRVQKESQVSFQIHMGDFGGVVEPKLGDLPLKDDFVHTSEYLPLLDALSSTGFTSKSAIFELGAVFYELLTSGKKPYPIYCRYPRMNKPFDEQPLRGAGVSEKGIAFIKRMCHPDLLQRPTALQAKSEWAAC